MDVAEAVRKLRARLPLEQRQKRLAPGLRQLHRALLRSFHDAGHPPSLAELGAQLGANRVDDALGTLAANDLIVRGADGEIVGAYPFTMVQTPHRLACGGRSIHAMCALDALAVAPLFGARVTIDSVCAVTADPLQISQNAHEIDRALPSTAIHVGIRWQTGGGAAADTL